MNYHQYWLFVDRIDKKTTSYQHREDTFIFLNIEKTRYGLKRATLYDESTDTYYELGSFATNARIFEEAHHVAMRLRNTF